MCLEKIQTFQACGHLACQEDKCDFAPDSYWGYCKNLSRKNTSLAGLCGECVVFQQKGAEEHAPVSSSGHNATIEATKKSTPIHPPSTRAEIPYPTAAAISQNSIAADVPAKPLQRHGSVSPDNVQRPSGISPHPHPHRRLICELSCPSYRGCDCNCLGMVETISIAEASPVIPTPSVSSLDTPEPPKTQKPGSCGKVMGYRWPLPDPLPNTWVGPLPTHDISRDNDTISGPMQAGDSHISAQVEEVSELQMEQQGLDSTIKGLQENIAALKAREEEHLARLRVKNTRGEVQRLEREERTRRLAMKSLCEKLGCIVIREEGLFCSRNWLHLGTEQISWGGKSDGTQETGKDENNDSCKDDYWNRPGNWGNQNSWDNGNDWSCNSANCNGNGRGSGNDLNNGNSWSTANGNGIRNGNDWGGNGGRSWESDESIEDYNMNRLRQYASW